MMRICLAILWGLILVVPLTLGEGWAQAGKSTPAGKSAMGGVGLYLDYDPPGSGNIVVYSVTYKSPADKAKVKRGDQLLKIDGKEVGGKSLEEVAGWIRGPVGTSVTLTLQRGGSVREVVLARKTMKARSPVVLPPPSQIGQGRFLTASEKALVKQKILSLKTEAQRQRMLELLTAFKNKKLSKPKFMRAIKTEFP